MADTGEKKGRSRVRSKEVIIGSTQDASEQEIADQAFIDAVKAGDMAAVQEAIATGQEVNVGDEAGTSAVAYACIHESADILQALLAKGAYCGHANLKGETPVKQALSLDRAEHLKLLLKSGDVDLEMVNVHSGNTLLHECAWFGHLEVTKLILQTKAFEGKMDVLNKGGKTALHLAAFRAPQPVVKLLIDNGASHDVKEKTTQWIPQDAVRATTRLLARFAGRDRLPARTIPPAAA